MFNFIKKKSYYGIYLQYQNANQFQGLDQFQNLLNQIAGQIVPVLVVDNMNIEPKDQEGFEIIPGDNSKREFSGYQCGLSYLQENRRLAPDSIIFFANDTFNVNYAGSDYLKLFLDKKSIRCIRKGMLVGYVDRLGEEVFVNGRNGKFWVRTSFFSIGIRNLKKILPFGQGFASDDLFTESKARFFSDSAHLSENYKNFLRAWLFQEKNTFLLNENWHSAAKLTSANFNQFKIKTQCIFSEFIFSQDALANGLKIFDVRSANH